LGALNGHSWQNVCFSLNSGHAAALSEGPLVAINGHLKPISAVSWKYFLAERFAVT
jgi:hypothetical protein